MKSIFKFIADGILVIALTLFWLEFLASLPLDVKMSLSWRYAPMIVGGPYVICKGIAYCLEEE